MTAQFHAMRWDFAAASSVKESAERESVDRRLVRDESSSRNYDASRGSGGSSMATIAIVRISVSHVMKSGQLLQQYRVSRVDA